MKSLRHGDRKTSSLWQPRFKQFSSSAQNCRKMNVAEKVTQWVEDKVGKMISQDIENKVQSEDSNFDISECSRRYLDSHDYFQESEIQGLQNELAEELEYQLDFESDDSTRTDFTSHDSLDCENYDFQMPSLEEISLNLQSTSEDIQIKALKILEASPAEELIIQTSWTLARKILQDLLRTCHSSEKIPILVLKVFRRFLMSHDAPKIVCEGFITLTESISFHIELMNSGEEFVSSTVFDFKENRWFRKEGTEANSESQNKPVQESLGVEILIRSMWLLNEAQRAMPVKWIRFNETRLREIIFSFIHLLASSVSTENEKVSALEILSVLSPAATWCRHWCHGAAGRSLLCSALRRHKKFFTHVIEVILSNMKNKQSLKHSRQIQGTDFVMQGLPLNPSSRIDNGHLARKKMLRSVSEDENANKVKVASKRSLYRDKSLDRAIPPLQYSKKQNQTSKTTRSAPAVSKQNKMPPICKIDSLSTEYGQKRTKPSKNWIVSNIPREIVEQAMFCHCFSIVACVVRFRAGRSLFPVHTTSRKRQLTIQDLVLSMINYVDSLQDDSIPVYRQHMSEMVEILKTVESSIYPSRVNTQRAPFSHR